VVCIETLFKFEGLESKKPTAIDADGNLMIDDRHTDDDWLKKKKQGFPPPVLGPTDRKPL